MKKAFNIIGLALALLLAFSSCQKEPFLTFTGQKSFTFKDAGGSETITFSCNRAWTITSSESWLTVSPAKGEANEEGAKVTITCAANMTYEPRTATITIMSEGLSETISMSQDTNYGLMSEPTTFNLTNEAQNIEVEVKANVEYTITIDDACKDWISQVGTKALSSTKLTFSIAANESYDDREGKITISQKGPSTSVQPQVITVKQSQIDGMIVKDKEYEIGKDGSDIEIKLQTNVKVDVTIPDDVKEWISVKSNSTKALSDELITLTVAKNDTYYERSADIILNGNDIHEMIHISQAQTDALFFTGDKSFSVPSKGQNISSNLFHNIDFDVDATTLPSWISFSETDVDKENATISLNVSANTEYEKREAKVVFKGKDIDIADTIKISQHKVDTVYTDAKKYEFSWKGGNIEMKVYSNVDFSFDLPEWITEVSHSSEQIGNLTLSAYTFFASENLNISRTDNFIIKWNNEGAETTDTIPVLQECCTINMAEAGTLLDELQQERIPKVISLRINGEINGTDVLMIRRMTSLKFLNLENASIVQGGVAYYENYFTNNNEIGDFMFIWLKSIEEVILPKSAERIGENAFYECDNLKVVKMFDNVKELSERSFSINKNLISVNISQKVTALPTHSFSSNYSLKEITLPDGLVSIGQMAFLSTGLEKITIPANVTTIGVDAFYATKLQEIHIKGTPQTLNNVSQSAFAELYDKAILYVPIGTKDEFFFTIFGNFSTIIEE